MIQSYFMSSVNGETIEGGRSHAVVLSPLARAIREQVPLVDLLREQPTESAAILERLVNECTAEISQSTRNGSKGIIYTIVGAEPDFTSPMEYGGHFLELDRSILEALSADTERVVMIVGGADVYLDFVSDLPCELFVWSSVLTGQSIEDVRLLRNGMLCTDEDGADYRFSGTYPTDLRGVSA